MVLKLSLRLVLLLALAIAASAIERLDPPAVVAGGPAFTLKVIGTELEDDDRIRWRRDDDGVWRLPEQRVINDKLIELDIPAEWIATPSRVDIDLIDNEEEEERLEFFILDEDSAPVARDDISRTLPGLAVVVNVVANDSVPNGVANRGVSITRGARNGFVRAQADSTVEYRPNAGFEGEDTFAYRVTDVFGLMSGEAMVRVTVSTEEGFTGCQFSPANAYFPTHVYETHILNPPRHPPHRMTISLIQNGAPVTEPQSVMVTATKTAILDAEGLPSLTSATLQTDAGGRAVLLYASPTDEPYDRTEFEATWTVDSTDYTCKGMAVAGMGTLTRLWRSISGGAGIQAAVRDVEAVLARGGDEDISRHLDRYSPRMLAFAIARSVGFDEARMADAGMRLSTMGEPGRAVRRELANRKMLGLLRRGRSQPDARPRAAVQPNFSTLPLVFEP
ncbi:MAG: hypothetical protein GY953_02540, partial [bacterium]|nr:hypothetical protein [bacterium]